MPFAASVLCLCKLLLMKGLVGVKRSDDPCSDVEFFGHRQPIGFRTDAWLAELQSESKTPLIQPLTQVQSESCTPKKHSLRQPDPLSLRPRSRSELVA